MEHATVGARIKACRLAKGVSAVALAARAGVTENAIRKIESGDSKEPRFSTGVRIAAALGIDPAELVAFRNAPASAPNLGAALRRIRECRNTLSELGIAHVSVFGSVARGDETTSSDVDVIVEPSPKRKVTLFDLVSVQHVLERALGSRVDVVTAATLRQSRAGRAAQDEAVRAF